MSRILILAWWVLVTVLFVAPTAEAKKRAVETELDRLEIDDGLLAGVVADPEHAFTSAQMEALVAMAAREKTHVYNLFAAISMELAERGVTATVSGDVMRALQREYDLGGEDAAVCFASEWQREIRMGKSLEDPDKVALVFTMREKSLSWVRDVPEKYTLRLAKTWGFADISEGSMDEMFGLRGGWSIFTFRMERYGLVAGGTMTMKFRTGRPIPVEVHEIKRR